jgi:hypothetical protein
MRLFRFVKGVNNCVLAGLFNEKFNRNIQKENSTFKPLIKSKN